MREFLTKRDISSNKRLPASQPIQGFTVVEVLVALAVVVVLAAVTFPVLSLGTTTDVDRAREAAEEFEILREAINGFEVTLTPVSFRQNILKNPLRLSDLTTKISSVSGQPNSLNSCSQLYLSTAVTAWSSTGPYWDVQVTPAGARIADGYVAQDLMVVSKVDAAGFSALTNMGQLLMIRMPSVSLIDAQNLALVVDGDISGTGIIETVSFTPNGTNPIPVDYIVLINNC